MAFDQLDLTDRVAVVIGATSGIGRALAVGLAEAGAHVAPTGRREELVETVANEIESRGRKTVRLTADVANRSSMERLLEQVNTQLGPAEILVNSAGITIRKPTLEVTDDEWDRIMDTNVTGILRACQIFGRPMIERGYGRIINIASIASFAGLQETAAYSASKGGVALLTRSLGIEWGALGVNVNAIAPGVFPTDMNRPLIKGTPRGDEFILRTPLRRFGEVEELVGTAILLASPAASYITGQIFVVDGGLLAAAVSQ